MSDDKSQLKIFQSDDIRRVSISQNGYEYPKDKQRKCSASEDELESFFQLTREWASTGDILRLKDENSSLEQTHNAVDETKNFLTPLIEYSEELNERDNKNNQTFKKLVKQESELWIRSAQNDLKKLSPKKRLKRREEILTHSLFSRCEEIKLKEEFVDEERLDRGDFLIARIIWDLSLEKYHDHWTIVKERTYLDGDEGMDVIFISDISKGREKPKEAWWSFQKLAQYIKEGELILLRFNLQDLQDPTDFVIERAISYTIPHGKELPPMYFLLICYFGIKRPIFSAFHLSMCDEKTLLILQDENAIRILLFQKYEHGIFHVSLQENEEEIKEMSYDEILELGEAENNMLYYYPSFKVKSLNELMMKINEDLIKTSKHDLSHELMHSTIEITSIHVFEHGLHHLLSHGGEIMKELLKESFSHATTHGLAQAGGSAMHAVVAGSIATHKTRKARNKEKVFLETGGLHGYSRTKANRSVAQTWSAAIAGTGGSIGMGIGGAAVGQILIPIPVAGGIIGGVVGGVFGSILASTIAKKATAKVYDINLCEKCPLCPKIC